MDKKAVSGYHEGMIREKYIDSIKETLKRHLKPGERVFIFGSSVEKGKFNDIDLAILSDRADLDRDLGRIRDELEESNLPYKFDVINFNQAKESFRNRVMSGSKKWII